MYAHSHDLGRKTHHHGNPRSHRIYRPPDRRRLRSQQGLGYRTHLASPPGAIRGAPLDHRGVVLACHEPVHHHRDHPDREPGVLGCGVSWRTVLALHHVHHRSSRSSQARRPQPLETRRSWESAKTLVVLAFFYEIKLSNNTQFLYFEIIR